MRSESLPVFSPSALGRCALRASTPIMRSGAFAITLLLLVASTACTSRAIEQLQSIFNDIRTEQLRDWVEQDPQRDKLIVFVHGFNSNKNDAWGQFPALLQGDDNFKDFNIHRFGYPTKLCGTVADIGSQGQLLASFLETIFTSEQPKYRQVVLVGHSIGGLVILHALVKLEGDSREPLRNQDLKVLTFGTPYIGVENTEVLRWFCDNKQAKDLQVLNNGLGELSGQWDQRFNQGSGAEGRDTPQVHLFRYWGIEDRLVARTSACSNSYTTCEAVDGDHNSMVKPRDRDHLTYKKLKGVVAKQIVLIPKSSVDAVKPIFNGCYKRAVFTRMHAQMNHRVMFDVIRQCRMMVQLAVPGIKAAPLNQYAANLISGLEGIEREEPKESLNYSKIDSYKLEVLKGLKLLSRLTGLPYPIPENLTEETFFKNEEASQPPTIPKNEELDGQ